MTDNKILTLQLRHAPSTSEGKESSRCSVDNPKARRDPNAVIRRLPIPVRARLARGIDALISKELGNLDAAIQQAVGEQMMRSATEEMNGKQSKKEELPMNHATNQAKEQSCRLYDVDIVRQRLNRVPDDRDHACERKTLHLMIARHDSITPRPLPENYTAIMDEMDRCYPHFQTVTAYLRRQMVVASVQERPTLSFGVNLLLNGPAGVGKSSYLMRLSEMLGTCFSSISCAAASNGFDLVGLSSRWGNGKAGKLHELMVEQCCPNPIILLDEVEKAGTDEKSNLTGALFGLLEKNNARRFCDEFIDVPVDASMINWFATSNNTTLLDPAIMDRFVVLEVRAPNRQELKQMIPNIYAETRDEKLLTRILAPNLSKAVINKLAAHDGVSIRQVKRRLEDALSNALIRAGGKSKRRVSVQVGDLPEQADNQPQKKPIGFIW